MKKLQTEILIDATPEAVWETLLDFASYPDWNPHIVEMEGAPEVGTKLRAQMKLASGKSVTLKPTVTAVEPNGYFEWLGSLGIKGLFDGRHQFRIEATDTGTRFIQSEEFTGLLAPLLMKVLEAGTIAGFEEMNSAMKQRIEVGTVARG